MHQDLFLELSLIIAIGAGVSLVARLLKQPLIIAYIVTGLLVGPAFLDLVTNGETLEIFSEIGIALLLFLVGLGLNPKVIKEVGSVAVMTGVGQVLFTTAFGFAIVKAITGLDSTGSLYVAVALAFSSTIIILKLLSDKKEQNRLHGKIATGFLLVQDILATIALLVVSANGSGGLNSSDLLSLLYKGVVVIGMLYLATKFILPLLTKTISGTQELLFLFSIAWGLGIGALFKEAGFSLEVGALAAGVSLAGFSYAQEAASRLRPLRDFFIVLFFVILGSQMNLDNLLGVLPQALVLSTFVLIGNPIIVMVIMGILGYTKKTSFKTSLAVAQISEFSLVLLLLAQDLGQIDDRTMSLVTVVGLVTIAISSYVILYDEKLYPLFERYLTLFERKRTKREIKSQSNELLLFGFKRGGTEFVKLFKQMKKNFTIIDYDPEVTDELEKKNLPYIYGDATDPEMLDEAGIANAKLVMSIIDDHETNKFLLSAITQANPGCVIISTADSIAEAAELYEMGASYVMLPHYIGSEKISAFIKRSGLKKSEFRKFRDKHLAYLESHFAAASVPED